MNAPASSAEPSKPRLAPSRGQALAAAEVLLVYSALLLYIWRWQYSARWAWVVMLAFIVASEIARSEGLSFLGLARKELRESARIILPLALVLFTPAVIYGFAGGRFRTISLSAHAFAEFGGYFVWCLVQQYLAQAYFHRRLMRVTPNRHFSSALVALMFAGAHIPNPVLVVATLFGGFILAEVYARHPNIWPLAFAQAAAGLLIAGLAPGALIHNMRVGPGYYFYRSR